jgi:hypothetical protein
MNNAINILNASISDAENERAMRDKIVDYLHRVSIVNDLIALSLMQQTVDALQRRVEQSFSSAIARNLELNLILQQMQVSIVKLKAKTSYFDAIRKKIESISMTMKRIAKDFDSISSRNRQTREFTIRITDVMKNKVLQILLIKNIMIKLQSETKSIRDIIRLVNDSIKIQTKSKTTRKSLQKEFKIIKRLINSITIRNRIYLVRTNEIRINYINTNNQTQIIAYLRKTNAHLHLELKIKKIV